MAYHYKDRVYSGKSKVVTLRLSEEVYEKLKRNHPNVSEYLRERITYDVLRSHAKVRK